jgi:hypothetical protein
MNETEKKIVSKMLVEIILRAAPKATAVSKYGGVLYTLKPAEKEAQFCGIFVYKNHVQLAISNIPALKDPAGVLLGTGTTRRHVNFESPDDVDPQALLPLLKQAAKS